MLKRILVIRNDRIGDFMLAWPSLRMLKQSLPDCHVSALLSAYAAPLARYCPWIDEVLIDVPEEEGSQAKRQLLGELKEGRFDASLSLLASTPTGRLLRRAGIPYRLAPASKLAAVFHNRRVMQRRSRSAKPEWEYNLELARVLLSDHGYEAVEPAPPYLTLPPTPLANHRHRLADALGIQANKRWILVHPGNGGSSDNLSLAQYRQLIQGIDGDCEFIVTAGPGEGDAAHALSRDANDAGIGTVVHENREGLAAFAQTIGCADALIASSTGPLHIAGAADVLTVGFFPNKRSVSSLRWAPLNSPGRHMAFTPPEGKGQETAMELIDCPGVARRVSDWLHTHWTDA